MQNGSKLIHLCVQTDFHQTIVILLIILLINCFKTYFRIDSGEKQDQRTPGSHVMVLMLIATGK